MTGGMKDIGDFDPKREYNDGDGAPRAFRCPRCGGAAGASNHGGLVFCKRCHRRMPWIEWIEEPPVKEHADGEKSRSIREDGEDREVHSEEPDPLRQP